MSIGYRISEAAEMTGFTVSALRFYEKEGMVVPERTSTGYRSYHLDDIEDLRFLARAKGLGLTLSQIIELLQLLDDEDCEPVQTRLRDLVAGRIDEAQDQIADLEAFTARLQQSASRMGIHTPAGACDERCGCRTEPKGETPAVSGVRMAVSATPDAGCSLEPDRIEGRVGAWQTTVAAAKDREPLSDGVRLRFTHDVDVASLSQLAADEQTCCGFFTFGIGIHPDTVTLDVTGPDTAQSVIAAMLAPAQTRRHGVRSGSGSSPASL